MVHTVKDTNGYRPPMILAIETATMCGSVALVSDCGLVGEYSLRNSRTHSKRLLSGIEWLMGEAGIGWADIDGVAVSSGPGSFTGLRIGFSTAKGLVMAAGKPLLAVPTLDALAAQLGHSGQLICPLLDARKHEVYTAFFKAAGDGTCRRLSDYMAVSPEKLARSITEPVILLGDGLGPYGDLLAQELGDIAVVAPPAMFFPRAAAVGMLAVPMWRGGMFAEPGSVEPLYVRASEAELNLVRNEGK